MYQIAVNKYEKIVNNIVILYMGNRTDKRRARSPTDSATLALWRHCAPSPRTPSAKPSEILVSIPCSLGCAHIHLGDTVCSNSSSPF